MKAISSVFFFLANLLLFIVELRGQGTTYISSLNLQTAGSLSIGNDAWIAAYFQTGPSSGGYALDSIQLSMSNPSGTPADFLLRIWDFRSPQGLATLNGNDPSGNGVFTYRAESFPLTPNTVYWFTVTAATPVGTGSFHWNVGVSGPITASGWLLGNIYTSSPDGLSFDRNHPPPATPLFAVNATAVPEPASLVLVGCGGLLFGANLWRRCTAVRKKS